MEQPKFTINTTMSKEDYRRFLYIATFRRNKAVIPLLALISLIAGLMISLDGGTVSLTRIMINWLAFFALAIAVAVIKIEVKKAQRIKTDKTGTFNSVNTLKFYEDRIVFENEALMSRGELNYSQFYALMESKDYFIFYFTLNQASLIRKGDIEDLDAFKEFVVEKFADKYRRI